MEQIGWFVVGEGNFGPYFFSKENYPLFFAIESSPSEIEYWKNRGYDIIPAYINANDKEDYSFVGE